MIVTDPTNIDDRFMSRAEAAERYKETPVFTTDAVRDAAALVRTPVQSHLGDGVWFTACPFCSATHYSYGPVPLYASVGQHMVDDHEAVIPGINIGLLP